MGQPKPYFLIMLVLVSIHGRGQSARITGKITDSTGRLLDGATVRLYRDSIAVRQSRAVQGTFQFNRIAPGQYSLTISYAGYRDIRSTIRVTTHDSLIRLPAYVLQFGMDSSLLEVVVKATVPPVLMRKDTVVYNASAYKVRPNASVEELLKKLPGITVDKDGTITLNGKKVEKIYVGGKELPLNDPKIVTQGFNADMIAAVEAFDNTSEDARFMGLRDGNNSQALNFKLKRQYQNAFFGKAFVGMGQDIDRYTTGINIDRMLPGSWLSFGASTNSINDIYKGLEKNISSIPSGENRHSDVRINYSNNARLSGGYQGNDDLQNQQSIRDRKTFLADSSLVEHTVSSSKNDNQGHTLTMRSPMRIDSLSSMEFALTGAYNQTESNSTSHATIHSISISFDHGLSEANFSNQSRGTQFSGNGNVAFRHRFHQHGRYLVLNLSGNTGNSDRKGNIRNTVISTAISSNTNQLTGDHGSNFGLGFTASYSQPINKGHLVDLNYGINYNNGRSERTGTNYNPATGQYDLADTTVTNTLRTWSLVQLFAAGYNVAGKMVRYQLGIAAQDTRNQNEVLRGSQQSFSQNQFNWFPRASMQWQLQPNAILQLNYSGQTQSPTIPQLQPLPDLRNPLVVRIGNPDLRSQFDHTIQLNVNRFQLQKKRGWFAGFGLHLVSEKLVQSIVNLPGGIQQIRFENLNGSFDLSANGSATLPLGEDGRIKIGSTVHYGSDPSFLNGVIAKRQMLGARPDLTASYSFFERFSLDGDAMVDCSLVKYSIGSAGLTQVLQSYNLKIRYELPEGWMLSSDFHYQRQSSGSGLPVLDNRLLNAAISRRIFSNGSGQLRLAGYDVLHSATGISQSISDQSVETSVVQVPQPLFLASFTWNFRKGYKS